MTPSIFWNLAMALPQAYQARRRLLEWIQNLPAEKNVKEYILFTLLGPKRWKPPYLEFSGLMIYDMAFGHAGCPNRRMRFGELAARLGNTMDMADDVVDQVERTYEGRAAFLGKVLETALSGEALVDPRVQHCAAYTMMRQLNIDVLFRAPYQVKPVFERLVEVNKLQYQENDPVALLLLEEESGALIVESIALLLELDCGREFPEVRAACRKIGAFGQLFDNWKDIDQDLLEGVNTLGTEMIRRHGDSENMRNRIGSVYSARIEELKSELPHLGNSRSQQCLTTMKKILEFKYRNLQSSL